MTDALDLATLGDAPFDAARLAERLGPFIDALTFGPERKRFMRHATSSLSAILDASPGITLQERWERVEAERWPRWDAGTDRPWPAKNWTWGPAALVLSRAIRPGWLLLPRARLSQWLGWLPAGHPLPAVLEDLKRRVATVEWSVCDEQQRRAALLGLRLVLAGGYESIGEITDEDLDAVPVDVARGMDLLDAILCDAGGLDRTPQRGAAPRRGCAARGTRRRSWSRPRGSRSASAPRISSTWRSTRSGSATSTPRRATSTTRSSTCGCSSTSGSRRRRDRGGASRASAGVHPSRARARA